MKKNTQLLSSMNKNAILELLRTKGLCSRADISRELELSFPAVSSNVKSLMEANLVYEVGEGTNALGRKSTLLAFNSTRAFLVGVDIGRNHIRTMCADISGEIKAYYRVRIKEENSYDIVTEAISDVVEQAGITLNEVAAIGVGIPGIYNEKNGRHLLAPFVENWNGTELFARLRENYAKQTMFFENSVNLGAIGEHWKGRAKGFNHVVYMEFGVGFGAAVLIGGEILHGANGAAGEIGYMALEAERLHESFTNAGSLEELIPSKRINEYIAGMGQQEPVEWEVVFGKLKASIPEKYVDDIPKYFAMSIINTISVINPEIVIISGKLGCALYRYYEKEINRLVKAHIPFMPEIACSSLNERANVLGAISLATQHIAKDYENLGRFEEKKEETRA